MQIRIRTDTFSHIFLKTTRGCPLIPVFLSEASGTYDKDGWPLVSLWLLNMEMTVWCAASDSGKTNVGRTVKWQIVISGTSNVFRALINECNH